MHRLIVAAILLAFSTASAGAQIFKVPRGGGPALWSSLSMGIHQLGDVEDGSTASFWRFGSSVQYRASFEMDVNNTGGFGGAIGYSDVDLAYYGGDVDGIPMCLGRCDAHVKVWTAIANFHMGGGTGFHQVLDIGLGATFYRDFTRDSDGASLPPLHGDTDASLMVGVGFGYGFSQRFGISLVQDAAYTLHQREGLSGDARSYSQQYITRIGVRYGLGNRR
jgi:hypothetical protein